MIRRKRSRNVCVMIIGDETKCGDNYMILIHSLLPKQFLIHLI